MENSANLDNPPEQSIGLFHYALSALYLGVLGAALYFTASDQFWLRRYSPLTDGLTVIGQIQATGSVQRKTVLDTLWLPIEGPRNIFNADLIKTEQGSQAIINLPKQTGITIEENSVVRLKLLDGEVNIKLSRGEVKIKSSGQQTITLQRGSKTEKVVIGKGVYALKVDSAFGVQIAAVSAVVKGTKKQTAPKKTQQSAKKEKSDGQKQDEKLEEEATPDPDSLVAKILYDLPTPKDLTVFLQKEKQEIVVAARRTCPDLCQVNIFKDRQLWKSQEFRAGEEAVMRLLPHELSMGLYDWIFSTETSEFKSRFVIRQYNDDELFRALQNQQPIEIQ